MEIVDIEKVFADHEKRIGAIEKRKPQLPPDDQFTGRKVAVAMVYKSIEGSGWRVGEFIIEHRDEERLLDVPFEEALTTPKEAMEFVNEFNRKNALYSPRGEVLARVVEFKLVRLL